MTRSFIQAITSRDWWLNLADRGARTAVGTYATLWVLAGKTYDTLWSVEYAKGIAVAEVVVVLFALGASQVGTPDDPSFVQ